MNKVQQIKAEIERLKRKNAHTEYARGCNRALQEILSFIDSLPDVSETDFGKKEELVSRDLEEAAHFYVDTSIEWFDSDGNPCCYNAFIAGAKWQKQQMMKNAVDATARPDDKEIWADMSNLNLKDGDKVKILIIKED